MLTNYIRLLISVLLLSFAANMAAAKETVIALSPYNTSAAIKKQAADILNFAAAQDAGDRVVVLDGYHVNPIATITIPSDLKYKSPKSRMNANRSAIVALFGFSESAVRASGSHHPTVTGAVKLPQLLRFVAQNYNAQALDVLVLGSALYDDPNQSAFSMAKGYYPSDGHINASRSSSPFGTKDVNGLLKGLRVHIGFNNATLDNDRLNFAIHRFWTLYIERQGGKLVSFSSSTKTVFDRVKNKAVAPAHSHKLSANNKLEMIELRPVELTQQSIFKRTLSAVPLDQKRINRAEKLELGIAWDCVECDLDIYSQPFPNAPILSYKNKQSPQGRYWKDFVRSPNTVKGFETIAYHVPLDLSAVAVVVNFYNGRVSKRITGEIRVSVNGQTYASDFTINSLKGNSGKDVTAALEARTSSHPQTVIIDVLKLVKSGTLR